MTGTEEILSYLLTEDEAQNARIREAFEQGCNYGRSTERRKLPDFEINIKKKTIATLMRTQHWSLDEALVKLELPKSERQLYQKIFAARQPKKRKKPKAD